jgi:hypothetical protein
MHIIAMNVNSVFVWDLMHDFLFFFNHFFLRSANELRFDCEKKHFSLHSQYYCNYFSGGSRNSSDPQVQSAYQIPTFYSLRKKIKLLFEISQKKKIKMQFKFLSSEKYIYM